MARYIDADKLKEAFSADTQHLYTFDPAIYHLIVFEIDEAPTADVVPKEEVMKIFEEIETCMRCFEDDDDGYLLKKCEFEFFMRELKKKYTKGGAE